MGQVFALALFVEELCYDVGKWRTEDMEWGNVEKLAVIEPEKWNQKWEVDESAMCHQTE